MKLTYGGLDFLKPLECIFEEEWIVCNYIAFYEGIVWIKIEDSNYLVSVSRLRNKETTIKYWEKPEDIPLGVLLIRNKAWPPYLYDLITAICSDHILHGAKTPERIHFNREIVNWQWSRDGIQWNECIKGTKDVSTTNK